MISIPAAVLQTYAYLLSETSSRLPVISIVVSILSVSYGTTTMCFDFDLSPDSRIHAPKFYGYIPRDSNARLIVFSTLFLFSACHVTMKVLSIALFALVGSSYVVVFLIADMALFLLQKCAFANFRYWFRLDGPLSLVASLIVRVITKLLVDFTVFPHLRHPMEVGEKVVYLFY